MKYLVWAMAAGAVISIGSGAFADLPKKHYAKSDKSGVYLNEGLIIGGKAGGEFTLLDIRRHYSKVTGVERIVIDLGEADGQPLKNYVSFFQVALDKNPPKMNIDLSQVRKWSYEPSQVEALFSKSKLLKSAELKYNSEDVAANLVLTAKGPIEVEAFILATADKPGRIVLDIRNR